MSKMRTKRKLAGNAPLFMKRKKEEQIEEINYDPAAREEYLTGFHKRKQQRIKHAKEQATKREREEKIATRKALRETRKAEMETHVKEVNAMLRGQHNVDESEDSEWSGFEEPELLSYTDQYEDEDGLTTVTIQAVDVTRDGLRVAKNDGDDDDKEEHEPTKDAELKETSPKKEKQSWSKKRSSLPKKKKKKFRYETKSERKVTRMKERAGNKAKAKARRG